MLHFIQFLILLFLSGAVHATTTQTTTTQIQSFVSLTKADINEAYQTCVDYINGAVYKSQNPNAVCLWMAEGDIIQSYNPGTDKLWYITVSPGHAGWYRLTRFPVQPNVTPESYTHDQDFYLGEYFNLEFSVVAYRGTVLPIADGLKDHRGTYQGFRSAESCQKTNSFTTAPTYDPNFQHEHEHGASYQGLVNVHGITADQLGTSITNCSTPDPMGLSCQYTSTVTKYPNDPTPNIVYQGNQTLVRCDDLEDIGFPARQFLTGSDMPPLLYDLYSDDTEVATYNGTFSVTENSQIVTVHSALYLYNLGAVPLDTDGDGVEDSLDAFPNDPNETLDSDGDGVGDNADPSPYDPTVGGGGTGGGGGTTSGDFDGSTGDVTDPSTQPDDPINTTGADTASGSCAVEPVCSGSATDCAILLQIWKSNCKVEDAIGSTEDDTVSGGGNCSTPPVCTGDIIQCSILENDWHARCDALNEDQTFLDDFSDYDSGSETVVDLNTQPTITTFLGFTEQARTCPTPQNLSLSSGSFEMPYDTFCNLASGLSPLIIALAYLVGTRNIYSAFVGA